MNFSVERTFSLLPRIYVFTPRFLCTLLLYLLYILTYGTHDGNSSDHQDIRNMLLQSRPTCHRIQHTVINTVRGSCSFSFFPLPSSVSTHAFTFRPLDLIISSNPELMMTHSASWTALFLIISIPSPLTSL